MLHTYEHYNNLTRRVLKLCTVMNRNGEFHLCFPNSKANPNPQANPKAYPNPNPQAYPNPTLTHLCFPNPNLTLAYL